RHGKSKKELGKGRETGSSPAVVSPLSSGLSCIPVLPPRRGSFYVESGTGVSVGSTLAFWCREGYQLVGSDKIYCFVRNGKPQWSNYLPVCEAIPRPEDRGLRVAVLASVVSGIVILAMSLSFLICCLQERSSRKRAKREGRSSLCLLFSDSVPGMWATGRLTKSSPPQAQREALGPSQRVLAGERGG
uniref:Zgc:162331 n=1 Tax=Scophthalmus maximus TaxID=52904 RepID=A0A8D3BNC3_SCOMX